MDVKCAHCGALHWMDEKIVKSSATTPKFGMCCLHGKVALPQLEDPPEPLRSLYLMDSAQGKEFRQNIRSYNAAFAFTSVGMHQDHLINNGSAPYVVRIHGELHHLSGSLLPALGHQPSYAQLYIHDPRTAFAQRQSRNPDLRPDTLESIQGLLTVSHRYAPIYKNASQTLAEAGDIEDACVRLRVVPGRDHPRRHNLPAVDEVAVILPGVTEQLKDSRDIILRLHQNNGLRRISDGHPAYACLHYVLLFPRGEHGWSYDLRMCQAENENPRRVSQIDYCAYRMHTREDQFNTILRGGRLFQQYVVDMWARADQNRLNYLRTHQDQLRASLYSGLEDAASHADNNVDLNELGRRIILPSSYTGGPRHMQQCKQDSLAVARRYRKIDLFTTVTCNPRWPEITDELLENQTAADRPDLVARVFALKKKVSKTVCLFQDVSF